MAPYHILAVFVIETAEMLGRVPKHFNGNHVLQPRLRNAPAAATLTANINISGDQAQG
jgi:hypothetical protein